MEVYGSKWKLIEVVGSWDGSIWKSIEVDGSVWKLIKVFSSIWEVFRSFWK